MPTKSQSLHPLLHVLICLLLSCLAFIVADLAKLGALGLISFVYAAFRVRGGVWRLAKTLWRSMPLLLSLALVQLVFRRQGEQMWQMGFLSVSSEGVFFTVLLSIRLLIVIFTAKALAAMDFKDFSTAFHSLRLPEEFSFMLSYAVHLVPSFVSSWRSYFLSLRMRGIAVGKLTIAERLQIYKLLAISSMAALIKNSDNQAIALELRGFRSAGKRSSMHERRIGIADWIGCISILLLAAIFLGL